MLFEIVQPNFETECAKNTKKQLSCRQEAGNFGTRFIPSESSCSTWNKIRVFEDQTPIPPVVPYCKNSCATASSDIIFFVSRINRQVC